MTSLGADVIRTIPIFSRLSDTELRQMAGLAHLVTVEEGEFIHRRGENPDLLFILLEGQVAQLIGGESGTDAVLEIVEPINYFVLSAVFSGLAYLTSARALRNSHLVCISAPRLREMTAANSALALAMLDSMSRQYREATLQLEDLKLRRVSDRLARYLATLYTAQQTSPMKLPHSKRLLAARLGAAQEHLSRAFSALRPLGILTSGAKVYVKDPGALRRYAERLDGPRLQPPLSAAPDRSSQGRGTADGEMTAAK